MPLLRQRRTSKPLARAQDFHQPLCAVRPNLIQANLAMMNEVNMLGDNALAVDDGGASDFNPLSADGGAGKQLAQRRTRDVVGLQHLATTPLGYFNCVDPMSPMHGRYAGLCERFDLWRRIPATG